MSGPQVSVVVPNYNHGRFLHQRLDSVLNQSFRDFELIYLDDASTDDSATVLEDYRRRPEISEIHNKSNSGSPFRQWNRGVQEAQGEFVWIAESDDFAEPELLRTLVGGLEAHPKCGVAFCRSRVVDEWGSDTGAPDVPEGAAWDAGFVRTGPDVLAESLNRSNTIPNASAVVFRREVFNRVGGAPSDMRYAGDWLLWCRMLEVSDLFYSAEPLNTFRQHGLTQRHSAMISGLWALEGYRVLGHLQSSGAEGGIDIEAGLDDMVRKWMKSTYLPEDGMTLAAHREVYRVARQVDPRIVRRIIKSLPLRPSLRSLRILHAVLTSGRTG